MISHDKIDKDHKNTEIDILLDTEECDKGYGTDALRALIGYLFKKLTLHRVWLGTYEHNKRAIRAYEKVGFKKEGLMREDAFICGKYVNTIILSIL